ncbi:MAG: hypothetical protein HYY64_06340 [Candidatus Rokubacteria bacterium]|nr:hypothetical protein [Candidatus Rokubacteria bacterium]
MLRTLTITLLALAIVVAAAAAQTTTTIQTTTTSTNPNDGAFDKLSPGNQKIAQALYDAQQSSTQTSESTTTTTTPLSLDEIATMKQDGKGWGVVFKDMQANGQIPPDAKNLGQLVSGKYQPRSGTSGSTTITSASGKSQTIGKSGKGHFADSASGRTRGSSGVSSGSGKGYGHASSSGPSASAGGGSNGGGHGVGRGK